MDRYLTQEVILKKRDGHTLDDAEIRGFVQGVSSQSVSDAQIAAFTMAVWFRGMTLEEQMALTHAMRDSGEVLHWPELDGPVLDKHSTGGVGDLVSLILGPLAAACGAYVPMISGRGLGHTGGTLDKLESIPGFNTSLDIGKLHSLVKDIGVAIIGQTHSLAPADRRFYAVRDVTATVSSVPLIVASILSKKLAEGLDGLVMDVKLGSGAFMKDISHARELARAITRVSNESGLKCSALISDMNLPLAWSAGNAVEVREAIDYLKGARRHVRLDEVVRALVSEMLVLGGLAPDLSQAATMVASALDTGQAMERFARMVAGQGGPVNLAENPDRYLPAAACVKPVFPDLGGFVTDIDTRRVGLAVVNLGGGRRRAEDGINPAVGLSGLCSAGQELDIQTPMAVIHASNENDWLQAEKALKSAIRIEDQIKEIPPVLYERIQ